MARAVRGRCPARHAQPRLPQHRLSLLALPMYVALYGAMRRSAPGLAILGVSVVAVGTTLFVAANAALPMLELGSRYGAAERRRAPHWSPPPTPARTRRSRQLRGVPGFLLSEIGTLFVALAMLRGGVRQAHRVDRRRRRHAYWLAYTTLTRSRAARGPHHGRRDPRRAAHDRVARDGRPEARAHRPSVNAGGIVGAVRSASWGGRPWTRRPTGERTRPCGTVRSP